MMLHALFILYKQIGMWCYFGFELMQLAKNYCKSSTGIDIYVISVILRAF